MVVGVFDAEAQAGLKVAADGKVAKVLFAAQVEEANRNLLPVTDSFYPVWILPVVVSEATSGRIDAGPAIGAPLDVGIVHTGADRDSAGLVSIDDRERNEHPTFSCFG